VNTTSPVFIETRETLPIFLERFKGAITLHPPAWLLLSIPLSVIPAVVGGYPTSTTHDGFPIENVGKDGQGRMIISNG
jgi:hypothetical protein